uniref:F-box domain-containing protein n=1 Tax=Loa loa TaxID=7209 RepID=A0A1I7VFK7_LOALO
MDDAWRHVFQYFTTHERIRYERVSTKWMELLQEYWKKLDTVNTDKLCIDVCFDHWSDCVRAVLVRCSPNITSFSFGRNCQGTRHRSIKKQLLPDVLVELSKKAPLLKSFRVEDDSHFANSCFLSLLDHCSTLEEFVITRKDYDSEERGFANEKKAVKRIETLSKKSEIVDVREDTVITKQTEFDGDSLIICKNVGQRKNSMFGDLSSKKILNALSAAEAVGHDSCYSYLYIDDDFMEHIPPTVSILCISAGEALKIRNANFVSRLKKLRLFDAQYSFLSLKPLQDLVHHAPNLLYLDLSNSRFITDFSPIGELSKLRCLLLNGNRIHLKNEQLSAIINGCTLLEVLSLKRCSKLSNEDLKIISKCATLKELHLAGVTGMTDDTLICIAFGVPLLKILDISYCNSLTSKGLESLAMLQKLDHLCSNGIYDFDDNLVDMIRKCRPHCVIEAFHCRYSMSTNELFQMAFLKPMVEPESVRSTYQTSRYHYI